MPVSFGRMLPAHHLERRGSAVALVIAVAAALDLAAGTGVAYLAGFPAVGGVLVRVDWAWLVVVTGSLLVSFAGYFCACQGIFRVDGGRSPPGRQLPALVAVDFGGLLAHGGALDRYALQACGTGEGEAKVRVGALAGMEQGMLALAGCAAAITVLAGGLGRPGGGFTLPWAIIPVPGFVLGLWAAGRYADRFRGQPGWRGRAGRFLASVELIRKLFACPLRWWRPLAGMAVFWAADAFAAWAGMAAFGFRMDPAAFFVGFATGMVFTRRAGPLAGAGLLTLVLPLTIWHSGAPMAVAAAGVFTYRMLCVWLPLPIGLAVLPVLREMRQHQAIPGLQAGPAAGARSASGVPAQARPSGSGAQGQIPAGPREFLLALQTAGLGALVLLAFLACLSLVVRFPGFGDVQRGMYVTALVLAVLAAGLLLVPVACHRRMSRRLAPGQVIRVVNAMAAGGLAAAGLAVSAAVRLAARWAAPAVPADLAAAATAIVFAVIWFCRGGAAEPGTGRPPPAGRG